MILGSLRVTDHLLSLCISNSVIGDRAAALSTTLVAQLCPHETCHVLFFEVCLSHSRSLLEITVGSEVKLKVLRADWKIIGMPQQLYTIYTPKAKTDIMSLRALCLPLV
ncbi:hypothetical protein DM860_015123 [Cuscuta australis]|uniref:Uncharacterized protein n=1 Tax=Cuscuta australis TaxID=267555 RepID=A0A328DGZ0_9ASTE|nr:hypothetical protein DM860_015123 [Cuscuta australis]